MALEYQRQLCSIQAQHFEVLDPPYVARAGISPEAGHSDQVLLVRDKFARGAQNWAGNVAHKTHVIFSGDFGAYFWSQLRSGDDGRDAKIESISGKNMWFHSLNLGDEITGSRFRASTPPNHTLFGFFEIARDIDFVGLTCVDVGTMDGLAAFTMKQAGAERLIATDLAERKNFHYAKKKLGLNVDYRVPVQALDLPQNLLQDEPDIIHLSGILYHVIDPMSVILACRYALKTDGLLILETMYDFTRGSHTMAFNPSERGVTSVARNNVFWRPSKRSIEGMLELAGFEIVKCVMNDSRITFLARAARPKEMTHSNERFKSIHTSYQKYSNYKENLDFRSMDRDKRPPSSARYKGRSGDQRIIKAFFKTDFPLQPEWLPPSWHARILSALGSLAIHAVNISALATAKIFEFLVPNFLRLKG